MMEVDNDRRVDFSRRRVRSVHVFRATFVFLGLQSPAGRSSTNHVDPCVPSLLVSYGGKKGYVGRSR